MEFCPSCSQGCYHQVFFILAPITLPSNVLIFFGPTSQIHALQSCILWYGSIQVCQVINLTLVQLNCVLDGYAKNGTGNSFPKFSAKDYLSIYNALLVLSEETSKHAYHGSQLVEQLGSWACEGW